MFPWFTIAKYGIPLLIAGMIGFGGAWKIQGWRYGGDRAKLEACLSANQTNTQTIQELRDGMVKADKSCTERLSSKDRTIRKLKDIDNLRGKDEKNPDSGNPLCDALNGMFGNK